MSDASATEQVKFGTSGLRGLADALLDGPAAQYSSAFCQCLLSEGSLRPGDLVLIAGDRRPSSPAIREQIAGAIKQSGLLPVDCGEAPTPALALAAQARSAAAIMVTGSHIPANRNGLKFYDLAGEITKVRESEINQRVAAMGDRPVADAHAVQSGAGGTEMRETVLEEWRERYRGLIATDALADMRIGVYEGSSVATAELAAMIESYGATVISFGANAQFEPLDTEAIEPAVHEICQREIKVNGLDCVVSTDPDGDRPMMLDANGEAVRGDLLGRIAADWLQADHLSTTVNANSAIVPNDALAVSRTRIGSPFVIEAIETAIRDGFALPVGFEPNGGFLLGRDCVVNGKRLTALTTRDSFLPIFAALSKAAKRGGSIDAVCRVHGFNAAASGRLKDVAPERSIALLESLRSDADRREAFFSPFGQVDAIDWTDGMRVSLETVGSKGDPANDSATRIIHLRPSGNAPELRCYVEDRTTLGATTLLQECIKQLDRFL